MNNKIPELLSPAGSYEALVAAVNAGCNAVYLGGDKFGARANATNFSNEVLPKAIDFAHLHDVKVYFTANTLIKNSEMQAFLDQISFLYKEGIDGLIIQDMGALQLLKLHFPDLPLHGSTQMSVHNVNGVKFLEKFGFERVVLSRELSLNEIQGILNDTKAEIECFVHGALCYSYSGQCLFSSIIGGRSGNRGTCAQPCRLPYELYDKDLKPILIDGKYLISPKDIQTLKLIPDLVNAGIHSFKIEGRMKNANYVGLVTSLYRKYIDLYLSDPQKYKVEEQDLLKISQIYNRGGFSEGYYNKKNGLEMISPLRPNHQGIIVGKVEKIIDNHTIQIKVNTKINQGDCLEISSKTAPFSFTAKENIETTYRLKINAKGISQGDLIYRLTDVMLAKEIEVAIIQESNKLSVDLTFIAHIGKPSQLKLSYKHHLINVFGETVQEAKTSALSEEKIREQLKKTGNNPIVFSRINMDLDHHLFLSIKGINQLRRDGIALLIKEITDKSKRKNIKVKYNQKGFVNPLKETNHISVLVRNKKQFEIVKEYSIDDIYFELTAFELQELGELITICNNRGIHSYIALPRIIRHQYLGWVKDSLNFLSDYSFTGVLIRTLDAYDLAKNYGKIVIDYTANTFNNEAIDFWLKHSASKVTISPELNRYELSKIVSHNLEIVIYGFLPLMITAQCVQQFGNKSCEHSKKSSVYLKDRKKVIFKSVKDCKMCTNTIYNSLKTVLIDKYEELKEMGMYHYRLEFLDESSSDIKKILDFTMRIKKGHHLIAEDLEQIDSICQYTRGHYNRGVK